MSRVINIIATCLLVLLLFAVSLGFYLVKHYSKDLPSYEQLKSYTPLITTRLYTSDGKLLTEYSKEKRIFVPIGSIPKHLINAFLAAEDSNFYKHSGIDPAAIIRATIKNTFSLIEGEQISEGASTITQQVVKNFLLTNEKTFQRKIKEAILAFRMSEAFSKDEILELYLNQIYLGSGAYGVAAAAQVYFDKSVEDLTIEETALLATLPKAPSKLDPRKNIEKAKNRRDWVIKRMVDENFIAKEEAALAAAKPIILKEKNEDGEMVKANFFSDAVKKELTSLYGSENVFESGIVVRTTLNPELQKYAAFALQAGIENYDMSHGYRGAVAKINIHEGKDWGTELKTVELKMIHKDSWKKAVVLNISANNAGIGVENGDIGTIDLSDTKWARKYITVNSLGSVIKKMSDIVSVGDVIMVEKSEAKAGKYLLKQVPDVNGAFLAMDPHTGRVLAMMGGYIDAINQFNRSIQAQRQPGSVMKTFGYIAALESGLTPATIIMDEPISLDQGGGQTYQPNNYSNKFYGPTTLRTGLENSINVTTVRMASQVGLDKVSEVISRFGINSNPPAIYSSVLGSIETSLVNIVSAYSMIVNGGKKISPALIEKIQDRDGKTIYKRDRRNCEECLISSDNKTSLPILYDDRQKVTDTATSYQITSMLEGVVQRGTSVRAKSIGKVVGGKTGTTNNSIDSWFVGFSPDLVAGVYIGFDTPKTLGSQETGASVAMPVFIDFMKQALKNTPSTPFRVPDEIKFVKINKLTGALPNPFTPKKDIIFEAFKLDDQIESDESISTEGDNEKDQSESVGIY